MDKLTMAEWLKMCPVKILTTADGYAWDDIDRDTWTDDDKLWVNRTGTDGCSLKKVTAIVTSREGQEDG